MCGLAGFWQPRDFSAAAARAIAEQMANRIAHRGPDDQGVWLDETAKLALAHRRLSILDLSPAGHQPMVSDSGRHVIALNGEIYNHLELRREITATATLPPSRTLRPGSRSENSESAAGWRGHSDTETLLAGFEAWGIEVTLRKSVGMFAIALWDRKEKVLTLARDRFGEKPLYYGFQNGSFLFGSELRALKAHPDFLGRIDRDVICLYLRHGYIPAPHSIYKGIKKLMPGTYLQLPLGVGDSADESHSAEPKTYWCLSDVAARGLADPFIGSDAAAIAALDTQLRESIGLQMTADVPLGAFLSGGVDSSVVVALMQAQSNRPVKTFSIGFKEIGYNEAGYAKAVAEHLGTEHTELYVSPTEAMNVIPKLGGIYDEPFADSSQIPTFLVSQMARPHVTVSLSGDGGDELFCGYNSYMQADTWARIATVPFGIRKAAGRFVKNISPTTRDAFLRLAENVIPLPANMGEKLDNLATRLTQVDTIGQLVHSLDSIIGDPEQVVIDSTEPATWLTQVGMKSTIVDVKSQMMFLNAMTYLPDDILAKVDRAAMANSLETRVPLLDHRVAELAWALPMSMKIRDGNSKWILRQVLYQYVPKALIDRPKAGFSIPLGEWLRGPLRAWAEALLNESRLRQEGIFNAQYIHKKWQAHLDGKRNNQSFLWTVLMFQVWLAEQ